MDREREFTVVVCFCPNRSCFVDSGYSSRQRYRVLTRLRNLACHEGKRGINRDTGREIEIEREREWRERVIVTTASSDNRSIRDRSELPAAFPQDRAKRY